MSNQVANAPANRWMTDLVADQPEKFNRKDWPVTKFIYPGSHDACTWGDGKFDYNWKCQDFTLYQQMAVAGQRFLDIRLKAVINNALNLCFYPFHGIANDTADGTTLNGSNGSLTDRGSGTLIDQILTFTTENPGEIVILSFDLESAVFSGNPADAFNWIIWNLLGPKLLAPGKTVRPTYNEAISGGRNIILTGNSSILTPQSSLRSYFWGPESEGFTGRLPDDSRLYNDAAWQTTNIGTIRASITSWMQDNKQVLQQNQYLWVAQLQITPSGSKGDFLMRLGDDSMSPRAFALGGLPKEGGGETMGANREWIYLETFNSDFWWQNASVCIFDFAGVPAKSDDQKQYPNFMSSAVAYMNYLR